MNISYNWLKELIEIELSPEETAKELTRVGLAVEGVHEHRDDFVLDIDLTSNRPDCLSHFGVARELSVSTGTQVKVEGCRSDDRLPDAPFPSILAADIVKIEDTDLCNRFTARVIRNVSIGPSPEWLVQRLESIGERSINNVADVTNFVMLELGQPMHSFDLDKLAEKRILVRRARAGEAITTLDEFERKLDDSMLMVCDAERPVAVGGVMGGLDSSITDVTTNVLLEVAYFKRESVRATSRKLGLATEASYRFERGVDIDSLKRASDRATQLICELAGGEAGEFVDVYPTIFVKKEVVSKDISAAVKRLTGLEVTSEECDRILALLGIVQTGAGEVSDLKVPMYVVPTWRHDIAIEEDLVEEVARHTGYENIGTDLPPAYGAGEYQPTEVKKKLIRRTLVDLGYDEAIGYSFLDTKYDGTIDEVSKLLETAGGSPYVTLNDSVIEGATRMRATLIPGLLEAIRLNMNHQRKDLKLFELGKVFRNGGEGQLPKEGELFAAAITGGEVQQGRAMATRPVDFFDAKGAVESALDAIGIHMSRFETAEVGHLRPGQSASIYVGETKVGYVGRLADAIAAEFKFKQPVFVAELDLQTILEQRPEPPRYSPLPKYPSIVRDVSFIVDRSVSLDAIRDKALSSKPDLLSNVSFVDVYEGKGLGDDERSLTVRFEYRSPDRTLIEEEVTATHDALVDKILLDQRISVRK